MFLFSGMLAWNFFQNTLSQSAVAILTGEPFLKKNYLPKLIFPMSKVGITGIEFLFSLVALTLVGLITSFEFQLTFFLIPTAIMFLLLFSLGLGILVSVATVYFRDFQYLLGVFLHILYFATPILYPADALPKNYAPLLYLNPVYSQIRLFHELIYYGRIPLLVDWLRAGIVSAVCLLIGMSVLFLLEDDLMFRL
jgi:ABC-2 type transport system permease protein/lipopolysaccharide transport system permease protein